MEKYFLWKKVVHFLYAEEKNKSASGRKEVPNNVKMFLLFVYSDCSYKFQHYQYLPSKGKTACIQE